MKFLADENVPRKIVEWLRGRGDDVLYAAERLPGQPDSALLHKAESDGRRIISSDKDFGELVFRDGMSTQGVVLMRIGELELDDRLRRLEQVWSEVESSPRGSFVVITPQRVRIRIRP
jgi:predicted nuclease of predicted toxin-antitoxin system